MDKEEILEMSRKENANKDLFMHEQMRKASSISTSIAIASLCVIFVTQIIVGGGVNFGIFGAMCIINAGSLMVNGYVHKIKFYWVFGIMTAIGAAGMLVAAMYQLISSSPIM